MVTGGAEASDTTTTSPDTSKDKKKKNRCHTCKKKVGLTGMYSCLCHIVSKVYTQYLGRCLNIHVYCKQSLSKVKIQSSVFSHSFYVRLTTDTTGDPSPSLIMKIDMRKFTCLQGRTCCAKICMKPLTYKSSIFIQFWKRLHMQVEFVSTQKLDFVKKIA